MYSTQTFKSIGPPKEILRIYRVSITQCVRFMKYIFTIAVQQFFLAFFVCLQLSVFWLVAAMALWIDELVYGTMALFSSNTAIYLALFIVTVCILLPWVTMASRFPFSLYPNADCLPRRDGSQYVVK
jgi:hypothetical protein